MDVPAGLYNIVFVTDRDYSDGTSLSWMPLMVRDATHGNELWRTDGTSIGTHLVKDIWPGPSSGLFQAPFAPFGSLYLFPATNGSTSCREFWRTDGTEAGTISLATDCVFNQFGRAEVCNGVAYFIGKSGSTLGRLWRTDGTATGTYKVSETVNAVGPMRCLNSELLFLRREPGFLGQIWKTDGTEGNMQFVAEIDASRDDDFQFPVALNTTVVFGAIDSAHGREPWGTDGTESGTVLLDDIQPGASSGISLAFPTIERWDNAVYFPAVSSSGIGSELWRTDGTPEGTILLNDLTPAPNVSTATSRLTPTSSHLYFKCNVPPGGQGWCRTNGTASGTQYAFPLSDTPADAHAIGIGENIYLYYGSTLVLANGSQITELVTSVFDGHYLAFVNDRLLYATTEGGREKLWALELDEQPAVPTVSTWGHLVLLLGIAIAGTHVLRREYPGLANGTV